MGYSLFPQFIIKISQHVVTGKPKDKVLYLATNQSDHRVCTNVYLDFICKQLNFYLTKQKFDQTTNKNS